MANSTNHFFLRGANNNTALIFNEGKSYDKDIKDCHSNFLYITGSSTLSISVGFHMIWGGILGGMGIYNANESLDYSAMVRKVTFGISSIAAFGLIEYIAIIVPIQKLIISKHLYIRDAGAYDDDHIHIHKRNDYPYLNHNEPDPPCEYKIDFIYDLTFPTFGFSFLFNSFFDASISFIPHLLRDNNSPVDVGDRIVLFALLGIASFVSTSIVISSQILSALSPNLYSDPLHLEMSTVANLLGEVAGYNNP